ncbi:uncharacterized protein LOC120424984 [Culex pipiens pallens]|uniref:uncharacterized protein LOC120424984 n=1 Tax=Culex pipiens pallens TaxID=42434 RepID=UPI0019544421|nr:uncharacterized protein LOC120424984 [Culex pipiens pallens]
MVKNLILLFVIGIVVTTELGLCTNNQSGNGFRHVKTNKLKGGGTVDIFLPEDSDEDTGLHHVGTHKLPGGGTVYIYDSTGGNNVPKAKVKSPDTPNTLLGDFPRCTK